MNVAHFDDLHVEFSDFEPPAISGVDLITLAGDIGASPERTAGVVRRFRERNLRTPIVLVLGNHDHWKLSLELAADEHRAALAGIPNVHLLENDAVTIGGVLVVGATLWTDLARPDLGVIARATMNDFRRIRVNGRTAPLTPAQITAAHRRSVRYIAQRLRAHDGRALVLTHHAPSHRSWTPPPGMSDDDSRIVKQFYCAELDGMIAELQPAAWLHGHVHRACDYTIGATRIANNARGYVNDWHGGEPTFVPEGLIVEL